MDSLSVTITLYFICLACLTQHYISKYNFPLHLTLNAYCLSQGHHISNILSGVHNTTVYIAHDLSVSLNITVHILGTLHHNIILHINCTKHFISRTVRFAYSLLLVTYIICYKI